MIAALLSRVWPYLAIAGLVVLAVLLGRRNGVLTQRMRAMEARIQMQQEMRDAGDATPTDRDSVVERLRRNGF